MHVLQVVLSVPEWVVPRFLEIGGRVGAQRQLSKAEKEEAEREARESSANEATARSSSPSNPSEHQALPVECNETPEATSAKTTPLESCACAAARLSTCGAAELGSASAALSAKPPLSEV